MALFKRGAEKYLLKNFKISATPLKKIIPSKIIFKKSLLLKLKLWLFPHLKKSEMLTIQFLEAKVKQEQNIAAKTEAEINLLKIQEAREYNSIINEIFSDDGLPEKAKALKLAKLLENNHKINSLNDFTHETTK